MTFKRVIIGGFGLLVIAFVVIAYGAITRSITNSNWCTNHHYLVYDTRDGVLCYDQHQRYLIVPERPHER